MNTVAGGTISESLGQVQVNDARSAAAGSGWVVRVISTAFTPPASIGLRLVDVPVTAGGDPRARLYVVDHLAPGAVIHRRIQVSNTSRADTRIVLYAAGATIAHGQFEGSAGHTQDELSTWTSITPGPSSSEPALSSRRP